MRKVKVMLVSGMVLCFVMLGGAPMAISAQATPAKKAETVQKSVVKAKPNPAVKAAQEALIKDGAKIKADGFMGKKTRAAIKAFQKKNALKVTGKLDKATLAKLK